jgi:hypothetical protein
MKLWSAGQLEMLKRACHTHFVILSSIDLGSKMNVGNVTRERSAPGRSWDMICKRTGLVLSDPTPGFRLLEYSPLP